ncbi:MAG: CdaR family protein [Candidatus Limnocylindrales bacterium]
MKRALAFLVHNWPLKLGAVALSMVLYTGLVVSQNARTWSGQVPIEPLNQPAGAFLLDDPGVVTLIRLYAPPDLASQITSQDFSATIDLAGQQPTSGGPPLVVPVEVQALDPRIQVIDFRPRQVSVRLDPVVSKVVPVAVDHGTVPPGLTVGTAELVPQSAEVRGASTLVDRVARVVARVAIDPNGINVDADVDLVAVDERNEVVAPVDITPDIAHVRIDVSPQAASRTVPVAPQVSGTVAAGYQVLGVTVAPAVVTITGEPQLLAALKAVPTVAVDVSHQTSDVVRTVALAPPAGVSVIGVTSVQVSVTIGVHSATQSFTVGLTLRGARPDRTYQLSATTVLVTLGGAVPTLAALDPATLAATLDVAALEPGTHDVTVVFSVPPGTTLVAIAPTAVTVTVTVTVAATPSPTP